MKDSKDDSYREIASDAIGAVAMMVAAVKILNSIDCSVREELMKSVMKKSMDTVCECARRFDMLEDNRAMRDEIDRIQWEVCGE